MAGFKRITDLPAAGAIEGDELFEVSQVSATIRISATTISAATADNSFNDTGLGFIAAGFMSGDRVRVTGFTTGANNIITGVVTSITADKLVIGGVDGDVIVDEVAGATVTIAKWTSSRIDLDAAVAAAAAVQANTAKPANATHTGDVTGSTALTIAFNAVSNPKLADMAYGTVKGRISAGAGDPQDLSGTQVTSLLDLFTAALKGLVPPPGTPSGAFLRDDGTWAVPAGGGGGAVAIEDEGVEVTPSALRLNFTGAGVTVTDSGSGEVQIIIPSGGGGGIVEAPIDGTHYVRKDGGWAALPKEVPLVLETGNFTLALGEASSYIRVSAAGETTCTVPANVTVAFPIGTVIQVRQANSGQVVFAGAAGVTINTSETLKLRKVGSTATLIKVATNEWDLMGDLEAV